MPKQLFILIKFHLCFFSSIFITEIKARYFKIISQFSIRMIDANNIFSTLIKRIIVILTLLISPFSLLAQTDLVKIDSDYQVMYCSANNGIVESAQEIKLLIKGPKNKKWFVSYSINNSPAMILNGDKGIEVSEYQISFFLRNFSNRIQDYTIELKEAWLEDLTPLTIDEGAESATIQVLPLAAPELNDYYPKAKTKSTQNYSALIGKNSSYSFILPDGAELINDKSKISASSQEVDLKLKWPDKEGNHLLKLIETDAFGCNSDTIYAGVEIVKSFQVDLGNTKYICEGDEITLQPEIDLPSDYSFKWNTDATSKEIHVSEQGNYELTVTDLTDEQVVKANVQVVKVKSPEINIPDNLAFEGDENTIDIYSDGCSYLWSDGSTKSYNSFTESGDYSVIKTSSQGCSTSKSFKFKSSDDLFTLELPDVIHMCGEEKMSLSPSLSIDQDYTYEWNTGSTESTIPIDTEGIYQLTVTDPDGFKKSAKTEISYHMNPIIDLGADLILWDGETTVLDAQNPGADYIWNNGETTQTITINSGGVFVVEVSDQYGCSNKDTIIVDYKHGQKFGVFLGENQSVCQGDSAFVTVQIEGNPVYPLTYNWVNLNQDSPEIYLKEDGEYCVEVSDANGNIETSCIDIEVLPVPEVNLGKDLVSYPDKGIVLDAGTPNCFYTWSTGEITQKISVNTEGIYWVEVNNEFNCTAKDSIEVGFVEDYPFVGLPKAFSPNGDGHNDKLFIRGSDFKEATLIIYNRLGQKLFETKSINTGWDGFFKGEMQDIDVYIYVLEVTYLDGRSILKKGNVALLR